MERLILERLCEKFNVNSKSIDVVEFQSAVEEVRKRVAVANMREKYCVNLYQYYLWYL